MSDELVERLLDWPYQGETMAHEAAVLIKQLTAEAAKMLSEADYKYNRKTNDMIQRHAEQVQALTAERDRLRALVWAALDAWDIQDKDGGPMGDHWVSDARAALKGKTL